MVNTLNQNREETLGGILPGKEVKGILRVTGNVQQV